MGKPRSIEPHTKMKITIPATLAARVGLRIMDPITRKPKYGEFSKLITQLLEKHLAENPMEDNLL